MSGKIIQIIPADGWYIKYITDDGRQYHYEKASCWALYDDGTFELMDKDGLPAENYTNFEDIIFCLNLDMTHLSQDIPDEK